MEDSSPPPRKIAIIGAGIAGPVFALTILSNPILRQRYKPIIYDRLPDPKATPDLNATTDSNSKATYAAGAAVALTSNALYPLYSLGLTSALNTISCETSRIKIWRAWGGKYEGQYKYLNRINSPNWQEDLGTCLRVVERADLQELVLERLKGLGGEVVWGKKVRNVQTIEGEEVKLVFEDGEEVGVALVVGADGGWSGTRRHIIASANVKGKNDGDKRWKPEFAGADGIYGVSKRIERSGEVDDGDEVRAGDTHWSFLDSGMASTWALPEGRQFWTISFLSKTVPERGSKAEEMPKQQESKLYGADITLGGYTLEETEGILRGYENFWHPIVGTFGELFRSSERIVRAPLWYRLWEKHEISMKNVVLIGDAARLMLPTSGQGACFAIEDATILANALLNHPPSSENGTLDFSTALDEYVEARIPRSRAMTKQSYWTAVAMSWVDSWWLRWFIDLTTSWLPTGGDPKLNKGKEKKKDPMGWIYDMRYKAELRKGEQQPTL